MPASSEPDPRLPKLREMTGFVEYMGTGWGTPDRAPAVEPGAAGAAASHRARLSAALPGHTIVVASGRAPVRANDTYYEFRPDSDFFWLTGCDAEDAVLVMTPTAGGHDATVYVRSPAYPGDPDFFADSLRGELWVGAAPDASDWSAALDVSVAHLERLNGIPMADALGAGTFTSPHIAARGLRRSEELCRVLAELRMIKDDWEIAQLRAAVDATIDGFRSVIREIPTAIEAGGERWLQASFDRHARTTGNGPGYTTIVGSAGHAPTLHWVRCDGPVVPEELLLLDMGVEVRSYYTADITRTFPASGTFSAAQRQVHELVEKAHRAGLAAVQPGRAFSDFHAAAMAVIAQGLFDWDLLPVSVDEALSPTGQHHRRYLVCGIGHHLGIDVHDCARSSYSAYQAAQLAPGMVLTVEPGLYFHSFDETVPPELRGIGVRIEDDLLVTQQGSTVLSDALPLDALGLEKWMQSQR